MKKAIIDIDGVLNNYPEIQIEFMNMTLGTDFKTLTDIKNNLSYISYRQLKESYRASVYKHEAIPKAGAKELLEYLRKNNYLIYIVTSRQLFKSNMLEKTILWLRNNGLVYDYIYCSIKKDFTIFEKFGHVDIVIEDNCDNLINIQKINGDDCQYINVINSENINSEYIGTRVTNMNDVLDILGR